MKRPKTFRVWICPKCEHVYRCALPATAVACGDPRNRHRRDVVSMRPVVEREEART